MEEKPVVECCICGSTDQWQNIDQYRLKPAEMAICMKCGFCTYPNIISKTEDLKKFYEQEYREPPSVHAVFTGQRKLHYHNEFLGDLIRKWKKEGYAPQVFEIGSALGMFLKWIKDTLPLAEIAGTELNEYNVKIAKAVYGISLGREFDSSKKYDLISSYKVAEHIPNIHKELRMYAECLSENGYLYISVPIWFKTMCNFGLPGFDIDYYYHTNHINIWSQKNFETLLKKCGLQVVKENHVFYDSTYLCKRNDELMNENPEYDNPIEILDKLDRIKKASLAYNDMKFSEALSLWSAFPDAWVNAYESKRQDWHKKGFDSIHELILKPAKEACPDSHATTMFCVDICMRYNKWDLAMKYIDEALKQKPCDSNALVSLAACYRQMAAQTENQDEKIRCFYEAREITKFLQQTSFEHAHQAITWIFADTSRIPLDYVPKSK